jgi:hypothetical protein
VVTGWRDPAKTCASHVVLVACLASICILLSQWKNAASFGGTQKLLCLPALFLCSARSDVLGTSGAYRPAPSVPTASERRQLVPERSRSQGIRHGHTTTEVKRRHATTGADRQVAATGEARAVRRPRREEVVTSWVPEQISSTPTTLPLS